MMLRNRRPDDDHKSTFGTSSFGTSSFGTSSYGSDEAGQTFTPRRSQTMTNEEARNVPFDYALTHGRNNPFANPEVATGPSFGMDSFSNAPTRNSSLVVPTPTNAAAKQQKFQQPTSLFEAQKRGGAPVIEPAMPTAAAPPRSPSAGARVLRSMKEVPSSIGGGTMPMQSLRDSPFMKQPSTTSTNLRTSAATHSTPLAPTTASARVSTPFDSDASPIRPLQHTPATGASVANHYTPANSKLQQQEEHKELFVSTPFGSPPSDLPWPSTLSTPAHTHAVAPVAASSGLGFGARNPCAITVFGFAPHQAARILARFHQFGEIISREDGSSEVGSNAPANWTHLLYRTPVAASMALAQNGRVIDGTMVGVKPRTDQTMDPMSATTSNGRSKSNFNTPAAERSGSIFDRSSRKPNQSSQLPMSPSSIYAKPSTTSSAFVNPADTVHKSICSKLMEYLFNY